MSRLGDTKLQWGTTDATWGLIQTASRDSSVEKKEGKNGQGNVCVVEQYNPIKKVSGRYLYRAEGSGPDAQVGSGTAVLIPTTGDSVHIDKVTDEWANEDWRGCSFDGTYYPNLGS
jgi:hypothetical protein